MENDLQKTGNVGEWSEIYALAFILVNGGVYAATENQERNQEIFYKVLKILSSKNLNGEHIIYELQGDEINVLFGGEKEKSIKTQKIQSILPRMLNDLRINGKGRAFASDVGSELMEVLSKDTVKTSSRNKNDLRMVIIDVKIKNYKPETGFSIKSQLGSPSTLINASKATNFIFEILDKNGNPPSRLPDLHPKKVKDNVCSLLDSGLKIVYRRLESDMFFYNLSLIDSQLHTHLANLLLAYYARKATRLNELVDMEYPEETTHGKLVRHKIKEFLRVMALGMVPNTEWDGEPTNLGGLLIVTEDGDVLCYYLYNLNDFGKYLLNSTKFDTPSTSRHGVGKVAKIDNRFYLKLNLQIRFRK